LNGPSCERIGFHPLIRLVPLLLAGALVLAAGPGFSDPIDNLTLGEAFFMAGDLAGASKVLGETAGSGQRDRASRALYLLGRISLLTGDFRQSKEFFERAADLGRDSGKRWMALAGIGDALSGSGRHEEAIRRYRLAMGEAPPGVDRAVIEVKMALCEHELGRGTAAAEHLGSALARVPLLSGWVGREEEFYHSMAMIGFGAPADTVEKVFLLLGPVEGDIHLYDLVGLETPVREVRRQGKVFLEIGPLGDAVEAMILSERIKAAFPLSPEIVTR
jgi:tetratricopeptide (TPR) repeat protein